MVHRKILKTSGPIYKTQKTATLFPTRHSFPKYFHLVAFLGCNHPSEPADRLTLAAFDLFPQVANVAWRDYSRGARQAEADQLERTSHCLARISVRESVGQKEDSPSHPFRRTANADGCGIVMIARGPAKRGARNGSRILSQTTSDH